MLDNRHIIETPEGIELVLRPAGVIVRTLAYSIDFLIRLLVLIGLSVMLSLAGGFGFGMLSICAFLLEWFYPVLFEVLRDGRTPGKRLMNLQVLNDDGSPIGWNESLLRNLLRAADFLPLFYLGGIVAMLMNRRFQRLGDLAAGSIVVYTSPLPMAKPLQNSGVQELPRVLSMDEQRALLDFAESDGRLSPMRQHELANLWQPLTHQRDQAAVVTLTQYANRVAGRE